MKREWSGSVLAVLLAACSAPAWSQVYVSANRGHDRNDGTQARPLRTISAAVAALKATAGEIRVAKGRYDGTLVLAPGTTVEGGYSDDFGKRTSPNDVPLTSAAVDLDTLAKRATVLVATGTAPAVRGDVGTGGTVLKRLVVVGPSLPQTSVHAGDSIAIVFSGGNELTLDDVQIVAGTAAPGASGEVPAVKDQNYCGAAGRGGFVELATEQYWSNVCYLHSCNPVIQTREVCKGGGGETAPSLSVLLRDEGYMIAGGGGGPAGKSLCGDNGNGSKDNAGDGQPGGIGGSGALGAPGASAALNVGWFVLANRAYQWKGPPGGVGKVGGAGAGGGGGGGGGHRQTNWAWCQPSFRHGQTGGNGGRGGCGGDGGNPAHSGGISIAVLMDGSQLHIQNDVQIVQNRGGAGGKGGDGAKGSSGESGYGATGERGNDECPKNKNIRYAGFGGRGGAGGPGGTGGAGAGGVGGPSIGVAYLDTPAKTPAALLEADGHLVFVPAAGGNPGQAGQDGNPGIPGMSDTTYRFELR